MDEQARVEAAQFDNLWNRYFDDRLTFEIQTEKLEGAPPDVFNVYVAGNVHNNILLCLHGGGQTALSWSLTAVNRSSVVAGGRYVPPGVGAVEAVVLRDRL